MVLAVDSLPVWLKIAESALENVIGLGNGAIPRRPLLKIENRKWKMENGK